MKKIRQGMILGLSLTLLAACTPKKEEIPSSAQAASESTTAAAESETEETENTAGEISPEEETKIAYDNEEILYLIGVPDLNRRYVLSEDKEGKYLVFRSYSDQHLEFQYPEVLDEASYDLFSLSCQISEGDESLPGMTRLELSFTREQEEYRMFDEYDNLGEARYCGIRMTDIPTSTDTGDFVADEVTGSLEPLLESDRIKNLKIY